MGDQAYADRDKVFSILGNESNSSKDFVKRIFDPEKSPAVANPDGGSSTHRMAVEVGEALGLKGDKAKKWYMFPTVIRGEDGELVDHTSYGEDPDGWQKAWPDAQEKGDYIEFDSADEAMWLEKNWKLMWDINHKSDY